MQTLGLVLIYCSMRGTTTERHFYFPEVLLIHPNNKNCIEIKNFKRNKIIYNSKKNTCLTQTYEIVQ